MSDLHKKLILGNNASSQVANALSAGGDHHHIAASSTARKQRPKEYTPIPWTNYYDRMQEVQSPGGDKFRVYVRGESGPVFLFLHGGGFSGLSWSVLSASLVSKIKCQCYALDLRGHGMK